MTPRQMAAWLFLENLREQRRLYNQLSVNALAGRGDPKNIEEQMSEWEHDF